MKKILVILTVAITIMIGLVKPAYGQNYNKYKDEEYLEFLSNEVLRYGNEIGIYEDFGLEIVDLTYSPLDSGLIQCDWQYYKDGIYCESTKFYRLETFDRSIKQILFVLKQ